MMTSSCIRASRQLNTTRPSIRHGLSTFVPSIHIPKDDDDREHERCQPKFHMPINIIKSSAPYNNAPYPNHYTYNNNNANYNNMTTLRQYHTTPPSNRGAALVLTLGAVAATAKAGQYAIEGYKEWKEENDRLEEELKKNPPPPPTTEEEENTAKAEDGGGQEKKAEDGANAGAAGGAKKEGKRENIFANFFNMSVGSKYYEGGFEDTMTRKEAALILGVRESSATKRIKEAHRKLLILNHPDTGGSTYLSGKLNEAKELLLKGKK